MVYHKILGCLCESLTNEKDRGFTYVYTVEKLEGFFPYSVYMPCSFDSPFWLISCRFSRTYPTI